MERLVTKNEIHVDKDITEAFLEKNKRFIQITEQSFHNMLESYSVQLPVSEIKYLYDYIYIEEEQHG
ncbi:PRD domain-containing protein [[Clostridium] innocuum]|nr:PRD domain-containing protein [[Clostridium] innocuum]